MAAGGGALMPVDEALETLLARISPAPETEEAAVSDALGRVLAGAQRAAIDVPAHDNSAMDGFAVNSADLAGEAPRLPISQVIAAGHPGGPLAPGTAARIFTGAPIPPGADAVVIQEDTRHDGESVTVLEKPARGENVRLRGHDIAVGSEVLAAGRVLRPQDLGLLASLGIARVRVRRALTVAIVNTGDEVVAPDQPLGEGQIYDSNSYTLAALLERLGCRVVRQGIIADDLEGTRAALARAAEAADCIITTGGVSVGEEDHVRAAVQGLGELSLWKLAIKPGKPFAFGRVREVPFFGLPGNPVAVFVTFATLVRPCLLKQQGAAVTAPPWYWMTAGFEVARPGGRQEYLRVRLEAGADGEQRLAKFPHQGSSILTSLSWADGLAVVPAQTQVATGDPLRYIPFSALL